MNILNKRVLVALLVATSSSLQARESYEIGPLSGIVFEVTYNEGSASLDLLGSNQDYTHDIKGRADVAYNEFELSAGMLPGPEQRLAFMFTALFGTTSITSADITTTRFTQTDRYGNTEYLEFTSGDNSNSGEDYYGLKMAIDYSTIPSKDFEYIIGVSYSSLNVPDVKYLVTEYTDASYTSVPAGSTPDVRTLYLSGDKLGAHLKLIYKQVILSLDYGIAYGDDCDGSYSRIGLGYAF